MTVHQLKVSLDSTSGLPEDVICNQFHFDGPSADYDNPMDMVEDFYTVTPSNSTETVMQQLCGDRLAGTGTIEVYNLEEPQPRIPVASRPFSGGLNSGNPLPAEVALVLSFQADGESGSPQARRRNRIFLGPLTEDASSGERPSSGIQNIVCNAAVDMLLASNASVNWEWVAYSPTTAVGAGVANAHWPVTNGWMDNAWDTQRRRGLGSTLRKAWNQSGIA